MCIILFAYNAHPRYPLIVAANRDEFYHRPTSQASFWNDHPRLLAGRDLKQMGTWMGITRSGRFAAITNYRDPSSYREDALSRGHLVRDFLIGKEAPNNYLERIKPRSHLYNGFNLIVGDMTSLYYFSSHSQNSEEIPPGIHGLSNAELNTPWPKVDKGKRGVKSFIQQSTEVNPEALFQILANEERAPDDKLPNTGIGIERERALSSIFIKSPDYGTRSSTVMTIDNHNHVHFIERNFLPFEEKWKEVKYQFDIEDE